VAKPRLSVNQPTAVAGWTPSAVRNAWSSAITPGPAVGKNRSQSCSSSGGQHRAGRGIPVVAILLAMDVDHLESLSNDYDQAEAGFLSAVRTQGDRPSLAVAARQVANAASAFNAEAYRRLHASEEGAWMPLDQLTERTEVLAELWIDLAAAYEV
jgi:hypothetical protein